LSALCVDPVSTGSRRLGKRSCGRAHVTRAPMYSQRCCSLFST